MYSLEYCECPEPDYQLTQDKTLEFCNKCIKWIYTKDPKKQQLLNDLFKEGKENERKRGKVNSE